MLETLFGCTCKLLRQNSTREFLNYLLQEYVNINSWDLIMVYAYSSSSSSSSTYLDLMSFHNLPLLWFSYHLVTP